VLSRIFLSLQELRQQLPSTELGVPTRAAAFLGEHFRTVKGYDAYQQKAEIARKGGFEGAVNGFIQAASWGTPDRMLRGLEVRRSLIGDFGLNVAFGFGGTPYAICERGLRLFAKEVLPVLKSWQRVGAAPIPPAICSPAYLSCAGLG
jgi:hypothetical protein